MRLKWSEQRKFYDNPLCSNSTNKIGSKTVCVKFCVNQNGNLVPTESTKHPFKHIVSQVNNDQQAIVTGLYIKFMQNDFADENTKIEITNLFDSENDNDEDDTRPIYVTCPAKYHGIFSVSDELIYQPALKREEILMYATQEKALFEPSVVELLMDNEEPGESILFEETHPLISCLVMKHISLSELSKIEHDGKTYYGLKNETIEKLKESYNNTIFDNIHYTRFENCKIACNLKVKQELDQPIEKQKGIVIVLQINYVLTD